MSDPITPASVGCKQDGCTCKDARVLNYRHLRFIKWEAERRGQTLDRVVPAGDLSTLLVRSDEPENIESEDTEPTARARTQVVGHVVVMAPRCQCTTCHCDAVQTITHPKQCRECLKGVHAA